uniref:DNA-binding protein H-NS n=1 Tax=Candidatus Kentrum sp. MB TaxID=2138164 RepID=A0A450X8Y7_9GAMM|nr:MAG: DNA-binding protein H-NS [Candidatus Kentron sp. MB]VFK29704.1 MAG: DNA-binding protein H-NS [Candidatus Kentron sp. MB]VFK74876.1 MAG: DNA-binding protein H-NS [Candidatus Kentron sp. MB]
MSQFDLSNVSFKDMIELRSDLEAVIEARRKEEKQKLLQEIRQLIVEKGFFIEEIFGKSNLIQKEQPTPKYRNPNDPSQQWSGRGRQPRWITGLLTEGATLEDLLV